MKSRKSSVLLAIGLLFVAAYWYFSPYVTLYSMRTAAQNHKAEGVAEHVDFVKVRENLKSQMSQAFAGLAKETETTDNPFAKAGGMLGAALGGALVNQFVDVLITPEALAAAMREGKVEKPTQTPAQESAKDASKVTWAFERSGVNDFKAVAMDEEKAPAVGFVFERYGFVSWKLVKIDIPSLNKQ